MKKLVLSGSMQFLKEMENVQAILQQAGFEVVIPESENWGEISADQIHTYKAQVSKRYFDIIASPDTYGLLVVNLPKNGRDNYIGANAFAEIAIAFYFGKKIYIQNDIDPPCADELLAWGVTVLKGDLEHLKADSI